MALDFSDMFKIVTVYKKFFSNHEFFYKIFQSCDK